MSNTVNIKKISETHAEPEWLLHFRESEFERADELPKVIKRGVGMTALFPEIEPDYLKFAEYHVDATKGLEIYTWKEAMVQEEITPILKGIFESMFFPEAKDHFRAKAHALFTSGLVVYVQPNMKEDGTFIEEKLTLDTMMPKGSAADIVVVIVKEGAKFDFVTSVSGGEFGSVLARTFIVLAERDSHVRITEYNRIAEGAMVMHSSRGIIAGNANATWRELLSGDTLISSMKENLLIGGGATANVLQGIIGAGHGEYDVDVSVRHMADDTHSTIRTAGVGDDFAKILYRGLIDMKEGVHKVAGAQEATFLMLSTDAKIDAIPSLDIASSDVSCTHKLSISHIKQGDMFYPKIRGFSDEESRGLFLEGHFADVFSGEENADIMLEIITLLIKKEAPPLLS